MQNHVIRRQLVDFYALMQNQQLHHHMQQLVVYRLRRRQAFMGRVMLAQIPNKCVGPMDYAHSVDINVRAIHPCLPGTPPPLPPDNRYQHVAEGLRLTCIYTHRLHANTPSVPEPSVQVLQPYITPGGGGRPRISLPSPSPDDLYASYAPILLSDEAGSTFAFDTGLTRSFLAPPAITFNIMHLEAVSVPEDEVVDGKGRRFTYTSVLPEARAEILDARGQVNLCVHLKDVALLTKYPVTSVWGCLGRDFAELVQAVVDPRVPVASHESTARWQGGGPDTWGHGCVVMCQPSQVGHMALLPLQERQRVTMPASHPALSSPELLRREQLALMEHVIPSGLHLCPLALSIDMVPQLLTMGLNSRVPRTAPEGPVFGANPTRSMRALPRAMSGEPISVSVTHLPSPPAAAFGNLRVSCPSLCTMRMRRSFASEAYLCASLEEQLARVRRRLAGPLPAADRAVLNHEGQELAAYLHHRNMLGRKAHSLANTSRAGERLETVDSWSCIQGALDYSVELPVLTPLRFTMDVPRQGTVLSDDALPPELPVPRSWMERRHQAEMQHMRQAQEKFLDNFLQEAEQHPLYPDEVASQRYTISSVEQRLVVTAARMAAVDSIHRQFMEGQPLGFVGVFEDALAALDAALRFCMETVRGPLAPALADDDEEGSWGANRREAHDAFTPWFERRQEWEDVTRSAAAHSIQLLAATRMAQAEELGPVTGLHMELAGKLASLDPNAIMDQLRAPHGPFIGHWPVHLHSPLKWVDDWEAAQPLPRQWAQDGRGALLARLQDDDGSWRILQQEQARPKDEAKAQQEELCTRGWHKGEGGMHLFSPNS